MFTVLLLWSETASSLSFSALKKKAQKEKQILSLSGETARVQEPHPHPPGATEIMATYDPRDLERIIIDQVMSVLPRSWSVMTLQTRLARFSLATLHSFSSLKCLPQVL